MKPYSITYLLVTSMLTSFSCMMAHAKSPDLQPNTSTTPTKEVVSEEDIKWAVNLQNNVINGYKANTDEIARYESIYQKYNASNQTPEPTSTDLQPNTSTSSTKEVVSEEDIKWAVNLQTKITNGYKPNTDEIARYKIIFQSYVSSIQKSEPTSTGKNR
ncbi:hypothetical protein [Ferriphaselus amnicola]|uniref:hypothetical protein n=1 Tax=Ferriphaselus amnicola TaxID=1188319 RepID=UPI0011AE8CF1|nr:hypothetical protein [Ferriphaselus amnicola]